jgi:ribonuclease BN (tRNA processing enzyme)
MLELGPLVYSAWAGGLREPIEVWGPPPIGKIVTSFLDSLAYDIDIRIEDEGRPDLRKLVRLHEFEAPRDGAGPVFARDGLVVSATKVRHPPITNAYAYRFDAPGRSIVLSGDTTYSPELIALARDADVLVHEVMHLGGLDRLLGRNPNAPTLRKHLIDSHTTTEQLGHVAAEAGVKTLVLSHFVPGDDPTITDAMWTEGIAKTFSGEIVVGRDLMTI